MSNTDVIIGNLNPSLMGNIVDLINSNFLSGEDKTKKLSELSNQLGVQLENNCTWVIQGPIIKLPTNHL